MDQNTPPEGSNTKFGRPKSNCRTCGGDGAVLWDQLDQRSGLKVPMAFRCTCWAGMANYPSLSLVGEAR